MNNDELKQALLNGELVLFQGIEYYLTGIIYRAKDKKTTISVELKDKRANSVLYALPRELRRINNDSQA